MSDETPIENQHLKTVLPGRWVVDVEETGKPGYDWMASFRLDGTAGTLMVHVNLLEAQLQSERLELLDRFVDSRRIMLDELADGRTTQGEAAYSSSGEVERARFGAADKKAQLGILIEVRIHPHKAVVLQYMEPAEVGREMGFAQAILDGVRTY